MEATLLYSLQGDGGMEIPPPSHEEVKVAVMSLKNNKATGPDGLHDYAS